MAASPRAPGDRNTEKAELRDRALLILARFEREEPSPVWAELRNVIARTTTLSGLRSIVRDLRGTMGAMPAATRLALEQDLARRFGPDAGAAKDAAVVNKVRRRGRIDSEREYRSVQAYADTIASEPSRQDEFVALGALLDEYMAAP